MAAGKGMQIRIIGVLRDRATGIMLLDGSLIGGVIISRSQISDISLCDLLAESGELLDVTPAGDVERSA